MSSIFSTVTKFFWALAGLAIMLFLLYFVLNTIKNHFGGNLLGHAASVVDEAVTPPGIGI